MFQFAYPLYLCLLAVLLLFALLHYLNIFARKRRIARFGDPVLVNRLIKDYSFWRNEIKFWLLQLALTCFIVALARPQNGVKEVERDVYGIEAVVAMDVSNSMLARDVHPSRLDKAKRLVTNMMKELNDNQFGLVVFAGNAFTQFPVTSDFSTAKMLLEQVDPSMIEYQGTDIARAIETSLQSFTDDRDVSRAIFVITDGEDNEGGAVEAAKAAAEQGVRVYVMGIGMPEGERIPIPGTTQYIIDNEGNTVISKLNEGMCKSIAEAGKGKYIYVDNSSSAQEELNKYIQDLSKTKLESARFQEYNEEYQVFLIIGIILLVLDVLIMTRQNHYFQHINLFNKSLGICAICIMPLLASCENDTFRDHMRRGNRAYHEALKDSANIDSIRVDEACTEYERALELDSTNAVTHYNYGNAYMYNGQDSLAFREFLKADSLENDPIRQARIHHNIGVLLQSQAAMIDSLGEEAVMQKLPSSYSQQDGSATARAKEELLLSAIENYKEALRFDPHNDKTRYNLVLCQWQLKKEQQEQGSGGSDGQGNENNENQDNEPQQQDQQQAEAEKQQQQQQSDKQQQEQQEKNEQMIEAAMQREKETQQRIQQRTPQNSGPRRLQKNW